MAINTPSQVTTWKINPMHSSAEFAVKHMMFTTVRGRLAIDSGEIVFDETNHANSSVQTTPQVHTINTGTDQRDTHLKSPDFFNADEHPTITFKSTRVEHKGGDRLHVQGDLTIHGVTKSVILDTTANGQGTNPWPDHGRVHRRDPDQPEGFRPDLQRRTGNGWRAGERQREDHPGDLGRQAVASTVPGREAGHQGMGARPLALSGGGFSLSSPPARRAY